jgi:GTP-binding protein
LSTHTAQVRARLFFLDYAPVVALSAKTGRDVQRLFNWIEKIRQQATYRVSTGELNRLLRSVIGGRSPPTQGKQRFKLLYATQIVPPRPSPFAVPEFLLFVNNPRLLPESYLNFLRARLRERWKFFGLPILLKQRGRERREPAG